MNSPSTWPTCEAASTPKAASRAFGHRASWRYALTDDTLVELLVAADDLVLGESRTRILRRGGAHRAPAVRVSEHRERGLRHAVDVAHVAHEAVLAFANELRQ